MQDVWQYRSQLYLQKICFLSFYNMCTLHPPFFVCLCSCFPFLSSSSSLPHPLLLLFIINLCCPLLLLFLISFHSFYFLSLSFTFLFFLPPTLLIHPLPLIASIYQRKIWDLTNARLCPFKSYIYKMTVNTYKIYSIDSRFFTHPVFHSEYTKLIHYKFNIYFSTSAFYHAVF